MAVRRCFTFHTVSDTFVSNVFSQYNDVKSPGSPGEGLLKAVAAEPGDAEGIESS